MTEKELNEMSKDERIKYYYSQLLEGSAKEGTVTPFIVDGDLDEWARNHGYIPLEEALRRLSDIGSERENC